MRLFKHTIILLALLISATIARADDFADKVNLDDLKPLMLQHEQTLKTLDSFSRQMLTTITGHRSLDGEPSLYTVLDMSFRPDQYATRNIIKIKNAPLRSDFRLLDSISDAEKERIVKEGTISLQFWTDPKVQQLMAQQQATAVFKANAINQLHDAADTLQQLGEPDMGHYRWFAPATGAEGDRIWHTLAEMYSNVPEMVKFIKEQGGAALPPPLPGYEASASAVKDSMISMLLLREAWIARNAGQANECIATMVKSLPLVSPAVYPSAAKRQAEVIYNNLFQLTIPAIMLYFIAFVLFLTAARSGLPSLRRWGLRTMLLAFAVHTLGIAVRWWLVEKSIGNWFEAIPIKNMFESVMFSAWFGALAGLILEFRYPRGLFGAAASFVGTLAMVALFTVPYFFKDIGGEIGQVSGVLMSYWLYIHVTMVTASYSLIGMAFLMSVWWLIKYYSNYETVTKVSPHRIAADARLNDPVFPDGYEAGASAVMSVATIATPLRRAIGAAGWVQRIARSKPVPAKAGDSIDFLSTLDACNIVVLQLAFWVLGVGIILGAVWADQSWGRPWGWDPKETFALVTWIVYLIVVHVRVATDDKAWWTAVLSVVGFFVMLFNWIGVNFFLVGLHSYA